ncbi:hypothetical protein TNCV_2758811 [Trichonephila clavipes]|nr:hypothetical protein TNCV_2758811 [Trichonephila clavipes]
MRACNNNNKTGYKNGTTSTFDECNIIDVPVSKVTERAHVICSPSISSYEPCRSYLRGLGHVILQQDITKPRVTIHVLIYLDIGCSIAVLTSTFSGYLTH